MRPATARLPAGKPGKLTPMATTFSHWLDLIAVGTTLGGIREYASGAGSSAVTVCSPAASR
jgi:hypothetical protein